MASIVVGYLFPWPLSTTHVGSLAIILYILKLERGRIVWYMFLYSFCQEILFPGHVYGATLLAGTISALVAYWSHRFFLTNHSLYTGLLLGILALWSYRGMWVLYQYMALFVQGNDSILPYISSQVLLEETIVTELLFIVIFVLFFRKRNIA